MDELAARGLLFRNAFVAYPVCSSSKACLYTGCHNHDTGLLYNIPNTHRPYPNSDQVKIRVDPAAVKLPAEAAPAKANPRKRNK